ncbi:hypothetical protein [Undibacterium sp. WLX3042]|uniref:hypothetical protein n=1 Tax=Undibacterium sp. WLX3042 TaxID=3412686 RepID=UPI003C2F5CAC
MIAFEGFHGTSKAASENILKTAFLRSTKKDEWLGHGIYFFVDGISSPDLNADHWAKCNSRDSVAGIQKYNDYAILKSDINVDEDFLLDITTIEGLKRFNIAKEFFFNKMIENFDFHKKAEHNCILFNYFVKMLKSQAVKHNLYIKNKRERIAGLRLNVPNTTVLCVINAASIGHTQIVKEGKVNE